MKRALTIGLLGLSVLAIDPSRSAAQLDDGQGCDLCHSQVEFLRRHVETLDEARALQVRSADVLASAHAENPCSECHQGFDLWPHDPGATTESCASCHEEQDDLWHEGVHANPVTDGEEPAECAECHSSHQVAWAEDLAQGPAMLAMNQRCGDCHETQRYPVHDPHADTTSCVGCHAPHETRTLDDPRSRVAPAAQAETCGACHEEVRDSAHVDVHGSGVALRTELALPELEMSEDGDPATCTSCHGGHGMHALEDPAGEVFRQDRCSTCHTAKSDSYYGTYHGKATALGSEIVASCADCHSAHQIYPDSVAESWVHPDRLVATCGDCHEESRAAFVLYDSHPDPMDRERNPPLFFSYVFMNTLLFGVLVVFGLHTLLWWVRILIDRRRGTAHG